MDVAFMQVFQKGMVATVKDGGISVALLADASPQGGHEWLLAEGRVVWAKDLPRLAELQDACIAGVLSLEDQMQAQSQLREMIRHHVFSPMCLGARACSTPSQVAGDHASIGTRMGRAPADFLRTSHLLDHGPGS